MLGFPVKGMSKMKEKTKFIKSPLDTCCGVEIRSKGLTKKETELILAECRHIFEKIRHERKKLGLSSLAYLIDLK